MKLAGYRRASTSNISAATISKSNVKSPSEGSEKGKNVHKIEFNNILIIKDHNGSSQRARLWCGYQFKGNWFC